MSTIQLAATDFHLSDRIRAHVEDKLGSVDRYLGDVERCDVTIRPMPHGNFRADVQLHRSRGEHLAVHAEAESVYAAINLAAERARTRCRRLHRKVANHAA